MGIVNRGRTGRFSSVRRHGIALTAVACLVSLAACSTSAPGHAGPAAGVSPSVVAASNETPPASPSTSVPPTGAALTAALDAIVRTMSDFSGAVLVTRGNQVLLAHASGEADQQHRTPVTLTTRFRIASLTKQFTAMAILMLEHQGRLRLSDRICRYITNCPATWAPITLTELLTHTSGIPDSWGDLSLALLARSSPERNLVGFVGHVPLTFVPGSTFEYSNTGYLLLGVVIEKVSGMSYEAFLHKNIFGPLGMGNTGYDHGHQGVAVGYATGSKVADPFPPNWAFSAGALYSTVGDLHLWERALAAGTVIPKPLAAELERPRVGTGFTYYGYGVFVDQTGTANPPQITKVYHLGETNGFLSSLSHDPENGLDVVILTNHEDTDLNGIDDQLRQLVLGT